MVKEPLHNWLVVCPSNSPENTHAGSNGKATTAAGCTLDNQLIFDLWNQIITTARLLGTDAEFATRLEQRLKEMAPMQIGRWGAIAGMDDGLGQSAGCAPSCVTPLWFVPQ